MKREQLSTKRNVSVGHPETAAARRRVEALGWHEGSFADFLEMSPEEEAVIRVKLALSRELRQRRARTMTQTELAQKIQSSQSRVAKAEAGDNSVSVDLLIRAMVATGASLKEIGKTIGG